VSETGWPGVDETHDPGASSWVEGATEHAEFPVQNLPLGIFAPAGQEPRAGTAIGDRILDLRALAETGLLPARVAAALADGTLNRLLALPASERRELRRRLFGLLTEDRNRGTVEPLLHAAAECTLHLPAAIGDYTDFYVGIHHATNVGKQFRPDNPLLPNYKYVPIGYHGRASSIRPSGVPVVRPNGQRKAPDADAPGFGPSRRLDYELELGVWIGPGNALGAPIPIGEAPDHVAGLCLLNDWSARDIQAWEYQPLGPFLAKNFHSSISPWIVTAEALAPFRTAQAPRPDGDPDPLPYLADEADRAEGAFALTLEVSILTAEMRRQGMAPHRIARSDARHMYWTVAQIVTHHASNGCNLMPGDLLGTGTLSGPDRESCGSMLETSQGGKEPVTLPSGETRSFVEDGDEILFSARAEREGRAPIGFGECRAAVLAAPGHGG